MSKPKLPKDASPQEIREELAFLRQKFNSLSMRGHYVECVKEIEENLGLFYEMERWPENFFTVLRIHQKCYPSMNKEQPYAEYVAPVLKKNGIPVAFARLAQRTDAAITWNVDYFRGEAVLFEKEGALEEALSSLEVASKIEPTNAAVYLDKSALMEKMGREKDALELIEQSLELSPGNRQALNTLTRHHMAHNPAKALELVEAAIAATPDDAAGYGLKGEVLRQMGKNEEAAAAYARAMELDPYTVDYPYQRGELLYTTGARVLSVPQFRLAVALDDKHVPSLMRLSELSEEHQPEQALGYLTTVVGLEPKNKEACLRRARLLRRIGKVDDAIRQYRSMLELDPGCAEARGGLGELYLHGGEPDRALEHLTKAVELDPGNVRIRMLKAEAHQKLEQRERAADEYRQCTELDGKNARAWGELGQLYLEDKPDQAMDCLEKALRYAPENPFYHAAKAELLLKSPQGRGEAVKSLHQACIYDPGNAELHVKLGKLLEEEYNLASAMDHYQKAYSLNPEDAEVNFLLARLQMDLHPDLALPYVDNAIRLSVIRGEYYFLKAKIIAALERDKTALEHLLETGLQTDSDGVVDSIRAEGSLRVALMYIDRALELDRSNPAYLCFRAHLFFQMGQKGKALAAYESLLADSPHQHEALFGMARILAEKKGEEKKTREYFDKAIDLAPAVAEYHAGKAVFLARDPDRYDEAMEAFTAAININNQMWQVILEKARLYDRHGDLEGATTEYRRVLLLRPDTFEATARMAELLAELRPAFALAYIDHAVKLEPEQYRLHILRGKILDAVGQQERALEELSTALHMAGDTSEAHYAVAEAMVGQRPDVALLHCDEAIQREEDKAPYHFLRGTLLLDSGDTNRAKAAFQRVTELDGGNHPAREQLARIACLERDESAMERVEESLRQKPDCATCLYLKACVLGDVDQNLLAALEALEQAVKLEPDNILFHEKLVELLGLKHSFLKLALERRKLERLRKKAGATPVIQEPPTFETDGEEEEPPDAPGDEKSQ